MAKNQSVTKTAQSIGLPDMTNFEEMRKMVEEYNRLNKLYKTAKKTLSKDDQKKIGISQGKKRREVSEALKPFINKVFVLIKDFQDQLVKEFELTITDEKPSGQKWLTFTSPDGFKFCVNRYLDSDDSENPESQE